VEWFDHLHALSLPTQVHHWEEVGKVCGRAAVGARPGARQTRRHYPLAAGDLTGMGGVHITEIYPLGRSYLKSFFSAIEAFRYNRDVDG
jgi:hypothetical protein